VKRGFDLHASGRMAGWLLVRAELVIWRGVL
jgi:hypothetical protein